jgi:lipid-binding SYLF domain-containing protein
MRLSRHVRAGLVALAALFAVTASTAAFADSGTIRFSIYKAGWIIGGSGGEGTLTFRGRQYPLTIGGLSAGLVFGASKTQFVGKVNHIRRPTDVAGVYGAGGAGAAVGVGVRAIILTNEKGAVMELTGKQVGLIANADLSGMAISLD